MDPYIYTYMYIYRFHFCGKDAGLDLLIRQGVAREMRSISVAKVQNRASRPAGGPAAMDMLDFPHNHFFEKYFAQTPSREVS